MIGFIEGELIVIEHSCAVIACHGIGYEIECPVSTLCELPPAGSTVRLLTHLVVREDAHLLYGFLTRADRNVFRTLIRISGVGPKLALAILSGMTASELAGAVERDDVQSLIRLPGIGKKTAERLLIELRDRIVGISADRPPAGAHPIQEAIAGLVSLGYKAADAERVVHAVKTSDDTPEALIRAALRAMMKGSA
jgi:holliday junction DNA helicase RuvA